MFHTKANRSNLETISKRQSQIVNLQSDNVKLYEKMRYVESRGSSSRTMNRNNSASDVADRYQALYKEALDPFKRFSMQEERRKATSMNPAERIVLILTQILSANRFSRIAFLAYSALLHALVFFTLFLIMETPTCNTNIQHNR